MTSYLNRNFETSARAGGLQIDLDPSMALRQLLQLHARRVCSDAVPSLSVQSAAGSSICSRRTFATGSEDDEKITVECSPYRGHRVRRWRLSMVDGPFVNVWFKRNCIVDCHSLGQITVVVCAPKTQPYAAVGAARERGRDIQVRAVEHADDHDTHAAAGAVGGSAVQKQAGAGLPSSGGWTGGHSSGHGGRSADQFPCHLTNFESCLAVVISVVLAACM